MHQAAADAPWLSILIPVYNVQDYLRACLDSILSQADAGVEIIALNDVSTDQSGQLLQSIKNTSTQPIIILEHEKNSGLSASRNTMLDVATGDYIWFLDSDDIICPNAINSLRNITRSHNPDLVICDFFMLREHTKLKHKLRGELHRKTFGGVQAQLCRDKNALFFNLYTSAQLHIWSKIAKRSLWGNDLRFPVGLLMEDQFTTPRLFLRANTYYYCPEVWVGYRQRPGSILSTPSIQRQIDSSISAKDVLKEWLQQHPELTEKSRFAFVYSRAKMYIGVSRTLRKLGKTESLHWHRQQFFENTQVSTTWLIKQYVQRLWLWRLVRVLYHLRPLAQAH